ncbi:hypothetical protein L3C95_10305 [Chitinophaga filiformis]|uniref:hypothetical protein n=1 Tax=Chitinophaga filiformis TaxID=104663 RepID=UPI001F301C5C|nr:hypothetical protein [Chitinophaga filiformis]MCF6402815.1 hypothetical protein [Chitinophaga filiformis]MCF6403267.1 hypothetical protein [Chitinophaga filiformis]
MNIGNYLTAFIVCVGMTLTASAQEQAEQDSTGLPGDNFSLQGALDLFKQSASPEQFEKLLNSPDSKVNNLDLNEDGNTDYIRVINKKDNDVQVFILQALVSSTENQDIAVIELQKTGENNAIVQIVGDADIYGESVIAEPAEEESNAFNYTPATHGPSVYSPEGLVVNVWLWPCVRFVYAPAYTVWVSPWTWVSRPVWYHPWRPMPWHAYRPVRYAYARRYVVVPVYRIPPARVIYRPVRTTSVTVINRNRVVVNNYRTTRGVNRYTPNRTNSGGRQYQSNAPARADRGGNVDRGARADRGTARVDRGTRTYNNRSGDRSGNRTGGKRKRAERGN